MATTSPSSRLLFHAARTQLQPLGLRRFGRSRQWIDDHGWWLFIIDFSAPRWNQGSGLTVGAMWLWQDVGHLTFNVIEEVSGSEYYRSEDQFARVATDLADRASTKVAELRTRFNCLDSVARHMAAQDDRRGFLWQNYHAGIGAGLLGEVAKARTRFAAVLAEDPIAPWILEAQRSAALLADLVEDPASLNTWMAKTVSACRTRLNLAPAVPPTEGPQAADATGLSR
ncbi:hypothetical protein [Actinospica robiniae]|uniref:hypothetical protein n=1 Tax=Actinospica robiniae TaxID=304901 RepID=UPI0005587C68|nr:hypothetical protein [Actinospica robiniae]